MAVTPEGKIERYLKKEVEEAGGKIRKLKWIGKNGAPDRIMWWPGATDIPEIGAHPRMAFVELKAPGKKPTKVQEEEIAKLREDGFTVLVVDSEEAADAAILLVRDGIVVERSNPEREARQQRAAPKAPRKPRKAAAKDNTDLL